MDYLIPILIAVLGGISFVVYYHPSHGRKLINYFFPVLSILGLLFFIYYLGISIGITEGSTKSYDESSFIKKRERASDLLYFFGIAMIASLILWKIFDWLSHLFEDAKKKIKKNDNI
jgi:hypothetical protein